MATITITGLTEAANKYQAELRFLPFATIGPELQRLGINSMQVAKSDTKIGFQRKGGILRPYSMTQTDDDIDYSVVGQFTESKLTVENTYAAMKDHVLNYQEKKYANAVPGTGINQDKKSPLEKLIVAQKIITYSEDVLDALYHGSRDEADLSPIGAFDGYETIIKAKIVAGDIATGKKNLFTTGAFAAPVAPGDAEPIDVIIAMVRSANPYMRKNLSYMQITEGLFFMLVDSVSRKKNNYADVTLGMVEDYINGKTGAKVKLITVPYMGIGQRIIWTVPGNMDFGMDTFGDLNFVEISKPFKDPNMFQTWIQTALGNRITSLHQKEFVTNEQVLTAVDLSGDYV